MTSAVINLGALKELCSKYVEEYYTARKSINVNNAAVDRVESMLDFAELKRAASFHMVKNINDKGLRNDAGQPGPEGLGCLRPGKSVTVKDVIGSGMYGTVYKVDSKTAVKIQLMKESYNHEVEKYMGMKRRIELEKEISIKAGELGVGPKVHDVYLCCGGAVNDKACYMVMYMELLKGKTLAKLYGEGTVRSTKLARRALDLLEAKVKILQKHRIFHQDLHEGNIWVCKNKDGKLDVKILDYGYANYFDDAVEVLKQRELKSLLFKSDDRIERYVAARLVETGAVQI